MGWLNVFADSGTFLQMNSTTWGTFLSVFIGLAIPLILVAYAGMYSEHSGIINIGLEGVMIIGALVGSIVLLAFTPNDASGAANLDGCKIANKQVAVMIAVFAAGLAGTVFVTLLSFAANKLKADQTIAGTAMNIMAQPLAVVIAWTLQGSGQTQLHFPNWLFYNYTDLGISSADYQKWSPLLSNFLFGGLNSLTTVFAIILIPLAAFVLYKTKFGLRMRACGEHPEAAESLGINVIRMRYIGVAIGGFFGGIGGLAYTLAVSKTFDGQVAGYGFLALAVMIFGNWKAGLIIFAALFFSLFKTLSYMSTSIPWLPQFENIHHGADIYLLVPYVFTILILIFTSKKSQAPKAEGIPFDVSKRS
jgi:ABC-type uncharacterized transport system permease subunit